MRHKPECHFSSHYLFAYGCLHFSRMVHIAPSSSHPAQKWLRPPHPHKSQCQSLSQPLLPRALPLQARYRSAKPHRLSPVQTIGSLPLETITRQYPNTNEKRTGLNSARKAGMSSRFASLQVTQKTPTTGQGPGDGISLYSQECSCSMRKCHAVYRSYILTCVSTVHLRVPRPQGSSLR